VSSYKGVARAIAKSAGWFTRDSGFYNGAIRCIGGRWGRRLRRDVPDLPGCTSAGRTTDEALRNAIEAARLWAEDAMADGEELPTPRSVEVLRGDPEVAAALAEAGCNLYWLPLLL
jgi:predicted RNase H-like HicB family nuclease